MCGIVAYVDREGRERTREVLLSGLSALEYRGYDSAGVAVVTPDSLATRKREGELDRLREALAGVELDGVAGVGHTRWSTHGPPSDANAHPHTDAAGRVAVVHNGIVENYGALRDELAAEGVAFTSETDTEVVPHLVARGLDEGLAPEAAFRRAVGRLEGSYALACVVAGSPAVFGARQDSPLVVGVGADGLHLASDVTAFLDHTREVVYLEDGQFVTLRPDGYAVTDADGGAVETATETVEWTAEQTGKSGYDHYMAKEIHEQPVALRQAISGRLDGVAGTVTVEELAGVATPEHVQFVACGTSYHAALYGAALFREAGVPAQAFLASEYATAPAPLSEGTLVVGVTQSGETADTLSALREVVGRGVPTLAVTNVVGSTAARECDHALYIRAGPEVGVAATKTFSSQLLALNLLVETLVAGRYRGTASRALVDALRSLPDRVQTVLDDSRAPALAADLLEYDAYFFVGRGHGYPVALEGALKFKEVSYEHAEGFAAGELKHGPLALVTEDTPVFAVVTGDDARARKTLGNVKEVQARGAPVVAVTDGLTEVDRYADEVLAVPEAHERVQPVLANVQLQLVAYHVAALLGRSIDKPRNLAKSVTVE
jgi:glucosamine--fructose-6-phosphate aminotransferase (isomerizing)